MILIDDKKIKAPRQGLFLRFIF